MNFLLNEREQIICYCKKQIAVSFSCICPVMDKKFRRNIVKLVY